MDLYAYPRTHDLVLGASRLPGVERADGTVEIEPYRGRTVAVPGPTSRSASDFAEAAVQGAEAYFTS